MIFKNAYRFKIFLTLNKVFTKIEIKINGLKVVVDEDKPQASRGKRTRALLHYGVRLRSDQIEWLKTHPNPAEIVREALDTYRRWLRYRKWMENPKKKQPPI